MTAVSAARRKAAPRSFENSTSATAYDTATATMVTSTSRPVSVLKGRQVTLFRRVR